MLPDGSHRIQVGRVRRQEFQAQVREILQQLLDELAQCICPHLFPEVVNAKLGAALADALIHADDRFLDCEVRSFDLSVGPKVIGFGQRMVDVVLGAGVFKGMSPGRARLRP